MHASRLEAEVPRIIQRVITSALMPLKASIDAFTTILEVWERGHGATDVVMALKVGDVEVRKDMDHMKADIASDELEAKMDEKLLGEHKKVVYEELTNLEGAMFKTTGHASLRDVFMVGSSGAKIDAPLCTDAPTDAVTEMQTSPRLSLAGWPFNSIFVVLLTILF
ncbi:hypothetical protein H5410_051188 [Solanum commersonii]|uniref:Uncharacterized protein n=1 Tax=Solanum commersonii TaxID=4109 RepID=A0A9J5WXI7_SOLCO|nr:hypothetical protein H5410_051188 [Solanum commersonii]